MSTHKFTYTNNTGAPEDGTVDHVTVTVEYDDKGDARIESVVNAFVQYLGGLTYVRESVAKHIKTSLTE
jgi:hypothetical protein